MDTIDTTAPVGGEGATSSQDTATNDTQTSAPVEAVSDGSSDNAEGQALLAGKYKSPAELEKAYKELEGKIGTLGQKAKVADIIQEKYGISADQLQAQIDQIEAQKQLELQQQNPVGYLLQKQNALEAQLALQNEEKELDGFLNTNPEYAPFRDKILNLGLHLEKDKSYQEIATEYFGQARAQGQKDAYTKIEVKKETQATGVMSKPERKFSLEDMRNMSAKELEQLLPHAPLR